MCEVEQLAEVGRRDHALDYFRDDLAFDVLCLQCFISVGQLRRAIHDPLLEVRLGAPKIFFSALLVVVRIFQRGLPARDVRHFPDALLHGNPKNDVLKGDPADVFQRAPIAGRENAVDGLRPEHSAQGVIETRDDRRRHQYSPVAVESKKGKRTEDMEMCFNSPSAQVHKKRGHQHLRDRDNVASPRLAGVRGSEVNRQGGDRATKENCSDNVRVNLAARASPCAGESKRVAAMPASHCTTISRAKR